jgi:hypothetical protein
VEGFRVVTEHGRLAITAPLTSQVVEWGMLGAWATTMGTLFAGARGDAPALLLAVPFGLAATIPFYLLGIGRHERFTFDHNAHAFLRGRKSVCEESAIEAIEVESPGDSPDFRVSVLCKDGTRHQVAECSSHAAALHLAESIGEHTGLLVCVHGM